MNIFKILSSGDGSIKEPSVTAFLSYILDPNEGHGLNSNFLEMFLEPVILNNVEVFPDLVYKDRITDLSTKSRFQVTISIEKTVFLASRRTRDLDILIEISEGDSIATKYVFCIENKIKDGAIQKNQLIEQVEGIHNYYSENNKNNLPKIIFIYLTKNESNAATRSFSHFNEAIHENGFENMIVSTAHYFWSNNVGGQLNKLSVFYQIQTILRQDALGMIDPIHEHTKYMIKSFLNFILNDFQSYNEEKTSMRERKKYKKPVREYYKDLYHSLSNAETISVKEAQKQVRKMIKDESGIDINKSTLRCQLYLVTVNEKNRVHYGASESLSDDKNLFYYLDADRSQLLKFEESNDIHNVDIYWKESGQIHQEKYGELII